MSLRMPFSIPWRFVAFLLSLLWVSNGFAAEKKQAPFCSPEEVPEDFSVYDFNQLLKSRELLTGIAETPGLVENALAGPMAGVEEIVFTTRWQGSGHFYETFGYDFFNFGLDGLVYCRGGSKLCKLNIRTGELTVLLTDDGGTLRDPFVSYDGERILFSWRKGGELFHNIYEMNADGADLRRITRAEFDDVEPIYLPGGDIVFASSRAGRGVPCWRTPVGVLHRCGPNGEDLRMLSNGIEHEIRPWLLHDGRIVYCRWEYVNRSATAFHHLWTMNPDGTGSMTFYGNMHPGFAITEAKPIPGSDKIYCIFQPGHGNNERVGYLTLLDLDRGPDDKNAARVVSKMAPEIKDRRAPGVWRDPHPFSEDCVLICLEDTLYVMNSQGQFEALWTVPEELKVQNTEGRAWETWIHEPMPLMAHPKPPVIPDRIDYSRDTATFMLQDANHGRSLKNGEARIAKLLLVEALPMPVSFNWTQDTVSHGSGAYNIKRILGTVDVEEDGSAHFEVPAMRDIYFLALDENDRLIKEMKSFVCAMPGEVTGCVGCHEHRTTAPIPMNYLTVNALQRTPDKAKPLPHTPRNGIVDYPRDIQPIWDRHCADCHSSEKRAGNLVLSNEKGVRYHHSLMSLERNGYIRGSGRLISLIEQGHEDVKISEAELAVLKMWSFLHATYSGTYGSFGMAGDGTGMPFSRPEDSDHAVNQPHITLDLEVFERRCVSCHEPGGKQPKAHRTYVGRLWPMRRETSDYYNIEDPEKSLILLAPLAKEAGGLALCRDRMAATAQKKTARPIDLEKIEGDPHPIFTSKEDPDYQTLVAQVESISRQMHEKRVFPLDDFRPTADLLREYQRYGALPHDFDIYNDEVPDVFALDEAYYQLFYPGGRRFHEGLWKGRDLAVHGAQKSVGP